MMANDCHQSHEAFLYMWTSQLGIVRLTSLHAGHERSNFHFTLMPRKTKTKAMRTAVVDRTVERRCCFCIPIHYVVFFVVRSFYVSVFIRESFSCVTCLENDGPCEWEKHCTYFISRTTYGLKRTLLQDRKCNRAFAFDPEQCCSGP